MTDPYVYEGTNVLKNKLDIRDAGKLARVEIAVTGQRCIELQNDPIKGDFDFDHLKRIHAYIFQDLFDWAGQMRTVPISKGETVFCLPEHIESYASASVFPQYRTRCMSAKDDMAAFVSALADGYAELNMLHPFREGNGRAQREFARELCLACGYALNLQNTSHAEMLMASKSSAMSGNDLLEAALAKSVMPMPMFDRFADIGVGKLVILSADDVPADKFPQYN